jgi:hypothetical protein
MRLSSSMNTALLLAFRRDVLEAVTPFVRRKCHEMSNILSRLACPAGGADDDESDPASARATEAARKRSRHK